MTLQEAIHQADTLRPNTIPDAQKAGWLYEVDAAAAETMGVLPQINHWPEDRLLRMPAPHDEIYVLYLMAKIDAANQEPGDYANDFMLFNAAFAKATAWWRRGHCPAGGQQWEVGV